MAAHMYGLQALARDPGKSIRPSHYCDINNGTPLFPLKHNEGLGYDFAIVSSLVMGVWKNYPWRERLLPCITATSELMRYKDAALRELEYQLSLGEKLDDFKTHEMSDSLMAELTL